MGRKDVGCCRNESGREHAVRIQQQQGFTARTRDRLVDRCGVAETALQTQALCPVALGELAGGVGRCVVDHDYMGVGLLGRGRQRALEHRCLIDAEQKNRGDRGHREQYRSNHPRRRSVVLLGRARRSTLARFGAPN